MPNRYWVGGTAAWDSIAGTKWSATSGGVGGESIPTSIDDVFFDSNSNGICTISSGNTGAKSITCVGFSGTIAGTAAIMVSGDITLASTHSYTHTGIVTINGSSTIITAGKTFSELSINGSGITVVLGSALNVSSRNISVFQGTFDTLNYSVIAGRLISDQSSGTRTINLGSSTVTLSVGSTACIYFNATTSLTFNAGTSSIILTNSSANIIGGSNTFYDISFSSTSSGSRLLQLVSQVNNLILIASALGISSLEFNSPITVLGTLTCSGSTPINRAFILSSALGTTRVITANSIQANNCDFRDITIAGSAAGSSPENAGDCGGNVGIVFPAPKTVYRVGSSSVWSGSNSWALSSNGAGSNSNFPLPQDTAIIDNAMTSSTLSLDSTNKRYNYSSIDCSSRTNSVTLNHNVTIDRYGSYILGPGVSITGTSTQTFLGRSLKTVSSYGKVLPFSIEIESIGGGIQLNDSFTCSGSINVIRGELDANNYNVTCQQISSTSSAYTRSIKLGVGLWTLTGTSNVWSVVSGNLSFDRGTANILLSDTTSVARAFAGGGLTYNDLIIGGATGTSTLTITGANTFNKLASTKNVAHTIVFPNTTTTVNEWDVRGSANNRVTLSRTGTSGSFTLVKSGGGYVDTKYLTISNSVVSPANTWYLSNPSDGGSNVGWVYRYGDMTQMFV